ncbi:MAG: methylmalonyl Co-A mutase-associated GTPase MeaB [Candidatus Kapabacteria bacterium]|nr:methylmalonyl Co-A mutase-associated GTPase MeaB [Candidatus Kapabacteria bacterium]
MYHNISIPQLAERIIARDRRSIAKGLTLIENTHPDAIVQREELLELLLPHSGTSWRIGITGSPGVGKSSFIETFGLHITEQQRRVAVLAVDPSSSKSGGSILGDKVRMPRLALHDNAFIRPSPSQGTLGGVARRTRECIIVCEAAGYDTIIIETVGVGQSETLVSSMVDVFILLLLPTAGDDIQGVKRGIMELADILLLTKSDIDPKATAKARATIHGILSLLQPNSPDWRQAIHTCSSVTGEGIDGAWRLVTEFFKPERYELAIAVKRQQQYNDWMNSMIVQSVVDSLTASAEFQNVLQDVTRRLVKNECTPSAAIQTVLSSISITGNRL